MFNYNKNILAAFVFVCSILPHLHAQNAKTIDEMSDKHQACLDSGINMLGCSSKFYIQMDSMLNVAYNNLKLKLIPPGRTNLKNDQLNWLHKRDVYFRNKDRIYREKFNKGEWGTDMAMINYDDKAEFVKKRVLLLIKRLQ
jgi:uncharacterized protein YecT (DUF1311 family)